MTRTELWCDCGWSGAPEELVSKTDDIDDRDFTYCPQCGNDKFELELIEEDE